MKEKKAPENPKSQKAARKKLISELIKEFDQIYKSEKDCQEKINNLLFPDGRYVCRECNSDNVDSKYGERNIKCLNCKKVTSITTNTFFHKTKSARCYLAPIWIMEKGIILNASEIGRVSNVVNSTGQHILKKITYVIQNKMSEVVSYVTSDQLINTICKRSKETRKRMPPDSEISDARNNRNVTGLKIDNGTVEAEQNATSTISSSAREKRSHYIPVDPIEGEILKNLSDVPIQLETLKEKAKIATSNLLPALTVLELSGVITRLSGDRFTKSPMFTSDKEMSKGAIALEEKISHTSYSGIPKFKLIKTIKFIKERFHGISRKYLQFYLAAVWVHVDRLRWKNDSILKACCGTGEISYYSIYDYVSPYVVKAAIIS